MSIFSNKTACCLPPPLQQSPPPLFSNKIFENNRHNALNSNALVVRLAQSVTKSQKNESTDLEVTTKQENEITKHNFQFQRPYMITPSCWSPFA